MELLLGSRRGSMSGKNRTGKDKGSITKGDGDWKKGRDGKGTSGD